MTVTSPPQAPVVITQPLSQTTTAGNTAIFAAVASGLPIPTVQWQVSTDSGSTWKNLDMATDSYLYLISVTSSQNGYHYRAVFTNSQGNVTTNAVVLTVNSTTPSDSIAPQWSTQTCSNNLDTSTSPYILHLSWGGATDNVGVAQYRVYMNNAVIATVSSTTLDYLLPTIATNSYYYFKIQAGDAAGNWSASFNFMGGNSDGPVGTQGYSAYDGAAGGAATIPQWNTADTTGWLRAYNAGTADNPKVQFRWSQPVGGDYDGLAWGYTVLADNATPPDNHIDSVNTGDYDAYRDYANRSYVWDTTNSNLHVGGYGSFNAWPESNTDYYFSMMARNWADTINSKSPIVHFNTAWAPMMYAESSGLYTYMASPSSIVSYVGASGSSGKQTVYNIVTNPVDPQNACFEIVRTGGTNPAWSVAQGAVDPHWVLTDKETGEVIPLTPNLVAVSGSASNAWTPNTGTFYEYSDSATGGIHWQVHVTYSGSATSTTTLVSHHTYVLSLNGPWPALYIPDNYTYSWEFTTAQADKVAPVWPSGAALTASTVTPTTVTLSWTPAVDNVGVTAYNIYRDSTLIAQISGNNTTYMDTGLVPGSTHSWYVVAQDYLVNLSTQLTYGPLTTPVDNTAPTWPSGPTLMAQNIQAASLDLLWAAALDTYPVTGYRIYEGDGLIATVAGNILTYHVTGLTPGQSYSFTIQAGDESGNWSTSGPTIITGTGLDTLAPTWPNSSTPAVIGVTATSIALSWPAATDNYKVDHYEVFANGSKFTSVAATVTTANVTGLTPASGNDLYIVAVDPSGNRTPGNSINQWVPSQSPTYGSGIAFDLISPSKNITTTASESDNIITCLVPAGDLHLRLVFQKSMNSASLSSGITLIDETTSQSLDLSGASFNLTSVGSPATSETVDFATTGSALQAGHNYAVRLASSISAVDASTLGKNFVWRFTTPSRADRVVAISDSYISPHQSAFSHHVELRADGTVWSWGSNNFGQLGNGTTVDSTDPVQASGLNHVIAVAAGNRYTLAVRDDGTVWGWGTNYMGGLGLGSIKVSDAPVSGAAYTTPTQVPGINGVQAIAVCNLDSSVLRYDGTVWGWGENRGGALGTGITDNGAGEAVNVTVPTQCPNLTQVTAIAAGRINTYVLRQDETVWAVGNNAWGQLGTGSTSGTSYFIQVPDLLRVLNINAERTHALAIDRDGHLWYWGNVYNPWPDGWTMTPIRVPDISNAVAVNAGVPCDIILCSDGKAYLVHYMSEYTSEGHSEYGPAGSQTFASSVQIAASNVVFVESGCWIGHVISANGGVYDIDTSTGSYSVPFHMPSGQVTRESYPPAALEAAFSASVTSGVAPVTVTFTDQSTNSPTAWAWDFNNDGTVDSTSQNSSYTYTSAGIYSVKLTVSNASGSNDVTVTNCITVTAVPVAAFSASVTSGVAPLTVTFTDQSTNSPTAWAWDFNNDGTVDSNARNPSYTYTSAGTYTVKLTATNSTGSDDEIKTNYITAASPIVPVAAFNASTTSGVAPLTVNFNDQSTNTPTAWAWDFNNDGTVDSTSQNASYTYISAGTYTVKLTATNAAGSDDEIKTNYITVTAVPVAAFSASVTSGVAPLTVTFTDQSTNSPTAWAWDFNNDGTVDSTARNPSYTYTSAGTYTVKLTATNSTGSDDEIKTNYITVIGVPVAAFSSDVTTGKAPLTVNFVDLSSNSPTAWAWDFNNDGTVDSTNQNPSYTFTTAGKYTVSLRVSNAAGNNIYTAVNFIDVRPSVAWYVNAAGGADFTTIQAAVNAANAGETIIVKNGSYPENVTVSKSLTLKSENPRGAVVNPASGNIFTVAASSVTIDGFTMTQSTTSTAWGIYIGSDYYGCTYTNNSISNTGSGIGIFYTAQGTNGSNTITNNTITLSQSGSYGILLQLSSSNTITGNVITDPYHGASTSGFYLRRTVADESIGSNQCQKNTIAQNTVNGTAYGYFLYYRCSTNYIYMNNFIGITMSPGGYGGSLVNSSNTWISTTTQSYSYNGTSYTGYLGNYWGSYYTGVDVDNNGIGDTQYSVPGSTTVQYDTYPLMYPFVNYLTTGQSPTASFSASAVKAQAGSIFKFTSSMSTGSAPFTYAWDFNNDGVVDSTAANPSYIFTVAGTYTVKLTITNSSGADTMTRTDYITVDSPVAPTAAFKADIFTAPVGAGIVFTDQSNSAIPITSWAWDFNGDGIVDSTLQNPTFTYTTTGTYSVSLTVTNLAGPNTITKTSYITIHIAPWIVDVNGSGDFTAIQAAINKAAAGDTISVKNGTYSTEVLTVGKALTLKSDNPLGATVSYASGNIFTVTSSNVTIDGFNITTPTSGSSQYGIYLNGAYNNCIFRNNALSNFKYGIYAYNGANNNIFNSNTISLGSNSTTAGIYIQTNCSNNNIKANTIYLGTGTSYGIYVQGSGSNSISNNLIVDSNKKTTTYGFYFTGSAAVSNNIIANTIRNTNYGFRFASSATLNTFYLNSFTGITNLIYSGSTTGQIWNSPAVSLVTYWYNGVQHKGQIGNYWSSAYTGTDANGDGIGDTAFTVNGTDKDNSPLMMAGPFYTVTATAGANGSITPSGSVIINSGETPAFTITGNAGYHVTDVLVDGVSQGPISTYTFPAVTADHTITATFAANLSQTISFDPLSDRGFFSPDFTVSANASSGLPVTFSASGNCSLLSDGHTVHITGVGNCTITAHQPGDSTHNAAPDVARSFNVALQSLSYSDAALTEDCNSFTHAVNHVYLKIGALDSSKTYRVTYYDGDGFKVISQDSVSVNASGILLSNYYLRDHKSADSGAWHVLVQPSTGVTTFGDESYNTIAAAPSPYEVVSSVTFNVASTAIPEFPTALTAMGVTVLCAVAFGWMRRKRILKAVSITNADKS